MEAYTSAISGCGSRLARGQPSRCAQPLRFGETALTTAGAAIGLNAAVLNIVTEWLSDMKLGYCSTGFYLNENFCCWGAENGN